MADEWLSVADLSAVLGTTGRHARRKADAAGWLWRPRRARGGGREYQLTALPPELAEAWRERKTAAIVAQIAAEQPPTPAAAPAESPAQMRAGQEAARVRAREAGLARFACLPPDDPKRLRAKAREWLVLAAGEIRRVDRLTATAARESLCARVNAGEIHVPPHVEPWLPRRHGVRALNAHTLYRWMLQLNEGGIWALTDDYGNRAGQSKIDTAPALYTAILGQMLQAPQSTAKDLHDYARTIADAAGALPSLRTVQRFRDRWIAENRQLWSYMTSPGKWKNHFQVAFGSHHQRVTRLNQVWELDSTPGDWMLTDGRHTVVGCIDLWSRRLTLRVSKTSSAMAVGQAFRRAVLDWGVPEIARTDNGKDYVSDYFSDVLRGLGVTQELCLPFASEQKGTIERALKTVCYGVLKLLPGYIGHNVAERQDIRDRRSFAQRVMTPGGAVEISLSSADLQAALDNWLANDYHQAPHRGEGMRGLSPLAKAATWADPIRAVDPRALDALLAPIAGVREVGKKGIRWDNRWYISPVLAEYVGDTVRCRYDEADLGRLYVYTDEQFLCVAVDPEMAGISRAEVAAVAKAKQRRAIAAHAQEMRDIKRQVAANAAEEVLKAKAAAAGKLIEFPKQTVPHTSPALQAGAAAARAAEPRAIAADTPAQTAAKAALVADMAATAAKVTALPQGPGDRYRRWLRLDRDIRNGLGVDDQAEIDWWQSYATTGEFRSQQKIAADFPQLYAEASA